MTLADLLLPSLSQMLGTLDHLLAKAAEDPRGDALLTARLADDMLPLSIQVKFTCGQAVTALERLTGTTVALSDADDATIAAARARVAATQAFVSGIDRRAFVAEDSVVEFGLPNGMTFALTAADYVRDWTLPQFYFHATTTYAILRHLGLSLGKADFVGFMMRHLKPS